MPGRLMLSITAGQHRGPSSGTPQGVAVISAAAAAAAAGFGLLGGASPATVAAVQAFAAGAILTMLADTMMPEGFEHGGSVGLITCAGFITAFLLSHVSA
jgi:zinc transporter, ZIP family